MLKMNQPYNKPSKINILTIKFNLNSYKIILVLFKNRKTKIVSLSKKLKIQKLNNKISQYYNKANSKQGLKFQLKLKKNNKKQKK